MKVKQKRIRLKMITIEHWSDYRCPFCYIADAEIQTMLASVGVTSDIEIKLHAYELDPEAPTHVDYSTADVFSKKYGMSLEAAKKKLAMIDAYGRQVGIDGYNYSGAKPTNSFDAHRLTKYAIEKGIPGMYERLMKAYFVDNVNISDHKVLLDIAVEMGLDRESTKDVLDSDRYADAVKNDEKDAFHLKIASVPTYIMPNGQRFAGAGCAEQIKQIILELRKSE